MSVLRSSTWHHYRTGARRPALGDSYKPVTLGGRELELGGQHRPSAMEAHLGYHYVVEDESEPERKRLRLAIAIAVVVHVVLLLVQITSRVRLPDFEAGPRMVYAMEPVRFEPPAPAPQQQARARESKKVRKIPIPDPTPDEPEPLFLEEFEDVELDIEIDELAVTVPTDAPSAGLGSGGFGTAYGSEGAGLYRVGGGVKGPVRVYNPSPPYTEEARQNRIQGVVLLEAIIDAQGNVVDLRVIRGIGGGLTESAMETVKQWRYEPATKDGVPVPVVMAVSVRFTLQ